MFNTKKRAGPPDRPFTHSPDCKILQADPRVEIGWSEIRRGVWEQRCVCGVRTWYAPAAPRAKLDPLDPATSRHGGGCESRTRATLPSFGPS
jgi:hypothetical protein